MVGLGEGGDNTLKAFICTILALICIYYLYSNFRKKSVRNFFYFGTTTWGYFPHPTYKEAKTPNSLTSQPR